MKVGNESDSSKVDVTKCDVCGADRGGVVSRDGKRERFICFQCNAAEQAGEGDGDAIHT